MIKQGWTQNCAHPCFIKYFHYPQSPTLPQQKHNVYKSLFLSICSSRTAMLTSVNTGKRMPDINGSLPSRSTNKKKRGDADLIISMSTLHIGKRQSGSRSSALLTICCNPVNPHECTKTPTPCGTGVSVRGIQKRSRSRSSYTTKSGRQLIANCRPQVCKGDIKKIAIKNSEEI